MSLTEACFQALFYRRAFPNTCCASKLKECLSYLFFSPIPFSWLLTHSKRNFLLISLIFLFCSFSFSVFRLLPRYIYVYITIWVPLLWDFLARILECFAISFSRGSSQTRDRINVPVNIYIMCYMQIDL